MLLPKGMLNQVSNVKRGLAGRIIKFDMIIGDHVLSICCIYAPNKDCPAFFTDVFAILEEGSEHRIIIGDFNLTMNPNIDRVGSTRKNVQALKIIKDYVQEWCLTDLWRCKHETERVFSWYRCKPKLTASRLDLAIVSMNLVGECDQTGYITGLMSDHLAFYCVFSFNDNARGRGYWK